MLHKTQTFAKPQQAMTPNSNDAINEAESAGCEFPPSTTELLQQAIIAFSRMENQDDELRGQGDEEEEEEEDKEGDEDLDIDGAVFCVQKVGKFSIFICKIYLLNKLFRSQPVTVLS